jgi:multisubunit Na+/H+ antiporter MnhC subunit
VVGKGENSYGEGWQKNLVFMYLPKRLNKHLIGMDIIGTGLAKSHLLIGKLSTIEKYMQ